MLLYIFRQFTDILRKDWNYVYLLYSYVYLLYYVCNDILSLDAGLLVRSHYPEGPATGHIDTGFSWFPCV